MANSSLPGKPTSLWLDTTPDTNFPAMPEGLTVDVAIVGGGIVGLTAATLLKEAGKTVAVIEAASIVQGVTGHTTAKVTSLHTLIYDHIINNFGEEKARAYADANQAAIEFIADTVERKQIDCDFTRTQAYTYTQAADEVEQLRSEADAAAKLGLPVTLTRTTPLPFPVQAAVRFDNQAQFHPRKYLLALGAELPGNGCHIFEQTRVLEITQGEPCEVVTQHGTIQARDVIIASHFPLNDKALYTSRLHPHRSYVLAVRVEEPTPPGMFIRSDSAYSIRTHPHPDGELLLIGGEGHKTGEGGDTIARYQRLEEWARRHWTVKSVEYRWSTQDNRTIDRVPYVGRAYPQDKHIFVATGFGGWGMTNGTASAHVLRDLVLGQENPWTQLYDPHRINLTGTAQFVKENINVAVHLVGDRRPDDSADTVAPGEGKVVQTEQGNVALYRDENGTEHRLSPLCPHMGCYVQWNPAEKSWDCPCHGSRFSCEGKVIQGPAVGDMEEVE